ncbi:ribonuclease Z [Oceanospirillum maris]|uniref:ribonuclease Z n=1 Tax=Oceanospirillum maris TaxID=64977 RepID=UPI0003F92477|nr:ribonuclease Z [Oceanospirillum maris]
MQITFLGTSSGAPSRYRNVSATAIQPEKSKSWVLVDCGEATQHQLLYVPLSPQKLAAVLITHRHGDHCYGLPGLLASCQLNGRTEPLVLVAPEEVWQYLQAMIQLTDLHITFPLEFIPVSKALDLTVSGFRITAHMLSHRVPSWAYRFEEVGIPLKLDMERLAALNIPTGEHLGRLQKGEDMTLVDGQKLCSGELTFPSWQKRVAVVAGDNDCPDLLSEACNGAHVLVHESTYTQDVLEHVGPEPQHSSAKMVAVFAQKVGLRHLLLTHFSPRYLHRARKPRERSIEQLREEAKLYFTGKMFLADDFEVYRLDRSGHLYYQENYRKAHKQRPHKQQVHKQQPSYQRQS